MQLLITICMLPFAIGTYIRGTPTWRTKNARIEYRGRPVQLKGINFHGIETDCRVPHGLWFHNLDYYLDLLQSHHFNAIRVPLSYEVMSNLDMPVNDACLTADTRFMRSRIGDFIDTFLDMSWERNMAIIFDMHTIGGNITECPTTTGVTRQDVTNAWKNIISRFGRHQALMGVELKNEAHGECEIDNVLRFHEYVINQLYDMFSGLFFIGGVQGSGDTPWGGTFADSDILPFHRLYSDVRKQERLVLAPHVYGPDVRGPSCENEGEAEMDARFGFLWANESAWKNNPIVVTEFGGYMQPGSSDLAYFERFLHYFQSHNLSGFFFWTLPSTSGDTGGFVNGDVWDTIDQTKADFLYRLQPNPTTYY